MGRRGPAPTPTSLKLLRGNPGKRALNQREPQPEKSRPKPPAWMDGEARAVWNQLIPQLEAMGILTRIDGFTLSRYCDVLVRWTKAAAWIRQHGETYAIKHPDGTVKCLQQWPQVGIAHKLSTALLRIEQEFGLTPASRSRIQVPQPPLRDKLDEFLSGAG